MRRTKTRKPVRNDDFELSGKFVPRDLFPSGRVKFSTGARGRDATAIRAKLRMLRKAHAWDILRAVQDRQLDVEEVVRRLAQQGEDAVPELRRDLAALAIEAIPVFGYPARGEEPGVGEAGAYIDAYPTLGLAGRSPHSTATRASELRRIGGFLRADGVALKDVQLNQVTRDDVIKAITASSDATNGRNNLLSAISGLYTWSIAAEKERARVAKRDPRWDVNPATGISTARRQRRPIVAAGEQIQALLAAGEPYQVAYVRSYLHLGFRLAELTHTRLHTDFDIVTWEWQIQARGPDFRCPCAQCATRGWKPKTPLSYRTLMVPERTSPSVLATPLHLRVDQVLAALQQDGGHTAVSALVRQLFPTEEKAFPIHPVREAVTEYLQLYPAEPGDFAFRNPRTNGVWNARTIEDDFKRLCQRSGVRYGRDVHGGITMHTLRHTCATDLLRAGVRESVIAAILGDTVKTVVETYVHLSTADLADGLGRGSTYREAA